MVRTGTKNSGRGQQGQKGSSGGGYGDHSNDYENKTIAKYAFGGKMKDGPISKLLITKTGYWSTQFKKIIETLPVLCAVKNFWGLNEVIWTGHDLVEREFMPRPSWKRFHANLSRLHLMVKHPPCGNSNRQPKCCGRQKYWLTPSYCHFAT